MPYINKARRTVFQRETFDDISIYTPGELNFLICTLVNNYIEDQGECYDVLNEVIGVLECAKLEVYRRVVAPYEDIKMEENGDIF